MLPPVQRQFNCTSPAAADATAAAAAAAHVVFFPRPVLLPLLLLLLLLPLFQIHFLLIAVRVLLRVSVILLTTGDGSHFGTKPSQGGDGS